MSKQKILGALLITCILQSYVAFAHADETNLSSGFLTLPINITSVTSHFDLDENDGNVEDTSGYTCEGGCKSTPGNHAYDGHKGVDFRSQTGTEVVAAIDGIVVKVVDEHENDWHPDGKLDYGNHIKISSEANGITIIYAHLEGGENIQVAVGDEVTRGQVIATSDNTGSSDGAHLHFEVRINEEAVDPFEEDMWITDETEEDITDTEHILTAAEYEEFQKDQEPPGFWKSIWIEINTFFTDEGEGGGPSASEMNLGEKKVLVFLGLYDNVEKLLSEFTVDMELFPLFGGITTFHDDIYKKLTSEKYLQQFESIFLNCGITDEVETLKKIDSEESTAEYFHDEAVKRTFRNYVANGGKLYATDWSMTTVARIFNEQYFLTNQSQGGNISNIEPQIIPITFLDEKLKHETGKNQIEVYEELGGIHLITAVIHPEVKILAEGTVLTPEGKKSYPMLLEFPYGKGKVVVENLHLEGDIISNKEKLIEAYFNAAQDKSDINSYYFQETRHLQEAFYQDLGDDEFLFFLWKESDEYQESHALDDHEILNEMLKEEREYFKKIIPEKDHQEIFKSSFTPVAKALAMEDSASRPNGLLELANIKYDLKVYQEFLRKKDSLKSKLYDLAKQKVEIQLAEFKDLEYITQQLSILTVKQKQLFSQELMKHQLAYTQDYKKTKQVLDEILSGKTPQAESDEVRSYATTESLSQYAFALQDRRKYLQGANKTYPELSKILDLSSFPVATEIHKDNDEYRKNLEGLLGFVMKEQLEMTPKKKNVWVMIIFGVGAGSLLLIFLFIKRRRENSADLTSSR